MGDGTSRWPRLLAYACIGGLTYIRPRWGLFLTIASLAWFEIPVLRLGYPNMFLSDVTLLACCSALAIRGFSLGERASWGKLEYHILYLPLLFACGQIAVSWLISMADLYSMSYEGFRWQRLLSMLVRRTWYWDIRNNPLHSISIVIGYGIQLLWIQALFFSQQRLKLERGFYIAALGCGALPVLLYALGQFFALLPLIYAVDIAGTLQNGNHLSFYAGLIALASLMVLPEIIAQKKWWLLMPGAILFAGAIFGVIVGRGRTVWIALPLTIFGIFSLQLLRWSWQYSLKPARLLAASVAAVLGVGVGCYVLLSHWAGARAYLTPELYEVLLHPSLRKIAFAGGREAHLLVAWQEAFQLPWTGIGTGNFFLKSGYEFDIHNPVFSWIVELGWLTLPLLLLMGGWLSWRLARLTGRVFTSKDEVFSLLVMVGIYPYVALGGLLDNFASYRSLLAVCTVALSFPLFFYPWAARSRRFSRLALLGGITLGLVSLASPQTRPYLGQVWREEGLDYLWHGPLLWVDLNPGECQQIELRLPFPRGKTVFSLRMVPVVESPSRSANLTKNRQFFAASPREEISLSNSQWHQLCFCNEDFAQETRVAVGLFSHQGEYLSLSQHNYAHDDRFISFAIKIPPIIPLAVAQVSEAYPQCYKFIR